MILGSNGFVGRELLKGLSVHCRGISGRDVHDKSKLINELSKKPNVIINCCGSFTNDVKYDFDANVSLTTMLVAPTLGWTWLFDSGFLLGFDLGATIPFATKAKASATIKGSYPDAVVSAAADTSAYKDAISDVEDTVKKYGSLILPSVTLLRIGWLF